MPTSKNNVISIFSPDILDQYMSGFRSVNQNGYHSKKEIIDGWIQMLTSGTLKSLKEEEIKSKFLNSFFGDVLGFNGNAERWSMREEKKVKYDPSKSDAALGYFSIDKRWDDVRAVIEVKDANADLDKKQSGHGKKTAVEQAFSYAYKEGGKCRWVIVTNMVEVRFYASTDINHYQRYHLSDLSDVAVLDELLFLFHRDRLIAKDHPSKTEEFYQIRTRLNVAKNGPDNIIDRMYYSLKRFEDLPFVDPYYICNLKPFNILEEHVWHFEGNNLTTFNSEICELLSKIEIKDHKLMLKDSFEKELLNTGVYDPQGKLSWVFTYLNQCGIKWITAIWDIKAIEHENRAVIGYSNKYTQHINDDQGIVKNIIVYSQQDCDCLSCNFRSFQFPHLFGKLESLDGNPENYTLETAYGNYLLGAKGFKASYSVLKAMENNRTAQHRGLDYFLIRLNQKALVNLIPSYYGGSDAKELGQRLRVLDIDDLIHHELDFGIDKDVRNYLVQLKEDRLLTRTKKKVQDTLEQIRKLKELYDNNGKQLSGPNLFEILNNAYFLLYMHINRNFLFQDIFTSFQEIAYDTVSGMAILHEVKEFGIDVFPHFYLTEGILHIGEEKFSKIFKPITLLRVSESDKVKIIKDARSFFSSFYKEPRYAFRPTARKQITIAAQDYSFTEKSSRYFSNICTVLLKIEVDTQEIAVLEKPMAYCLKFEDFLAHYDLERLGVLIEKKGRLFSKEGLVKMLEIAISRDRLNNHKYDALILSICKGIKDFHNSTKVSDRAFALRAISNCHAVGSKRADFRTYIHLPAILDEQTAKVVVDAIDGELSREFNHEFYASLLREGVIKSDHKNYFERYVKSIAAMSKNGLHFENEEPVRKKSNYSFTGFYVLLHKAGISLTPAQLAYFAELPPYEKWLLEPASYDYKEFSPFWLKYVPASTGIYDKIKNISEIKASIEKSLKTSYDKKLGEIYVKYFLSGKSE